IQSHPRAAREFRTFALLGSSSGRYRVRRGGVRYNILALGRVIAVGLVHGSGSLLLDRVPRTCRKMANYDPAEMAYFRTSTGVCRHQSTGLLADSTVDRLRIRRKA